MVKFILCAVIITSVLSYKVYGQHLSSTKGQTTLGLGLGLSYGAIGARLGHNLADHVNMFGG